jgi:hypothetical protein
MGLPSKTDYPEFMSYIDKLKIEINTNHTENTL